MCYTTPGLSKSKPIRAACETFPHKPLSLLNESYADLSACDLFLAGPFPMVQTMRVCRAGMQGAEPGEAALVWQGNPTLCPGLM